MDNNLDKLFPKDLYHSYVIESNPNVKTIKEIIDFLEHRNKINKNSPDIFYKIYESFSMEDSYFIKEWHSRLGIGSLSKVCIIAAKTINREAEQTLLKMIEEPAPNTYFFIIIPDSSILLDTILSRVHIIKIGADMDKEIIEDVNLFLKSNYKDRFDQISKIIKENKNEESSASLRYYANQFISEIENIYYVKFKEDLNNKNNIEILSQLEKSKSYLSTSGASVKMILENLALVI